MSTSNTNNGIHVVANMNALNEMHPSSASTSCSNDESSINGAIRMFTSPLVTPKNVVKPKVGGVPLARIRGYLITPKRSSELILDNAAYLSGLMSKCNRSIPELECDYESDFDE
mmetsp:Transcript_35849/g.86690  ORF Transcript_35849/g.86690 Transcript_35849/m.86690 type:complete len:114 (+) Transcript_35849:73-414(+)|eukprot:CAMPEP_0113638248 /NCGR_PEP_ID=MMETSP0017_2-20120614/20030_1 /TAXON_ID=2856 /ORGANISM="Cylindrotheca closterium" /LENGTH=113 /DNA_ID=CAMNT_0000549333 /DNA_START=73 /DNA_END=414 /DNA_ORIENTATION=+ /assembly_acc=CAM_ASM_000147